MAASTVHSENAMQAHSDSPAKQAEHNAAMALVSSGPPTHVATQSGSWFDPNTWQGGKVPGDNARVLIRKGISVNYDAQSEARLFTLDVDGQLTFATDKDTKMVIDTFVVSPEGKLTVGTESDPVKADVTAEILIADNGPIDLNWDPTQLSRGLISHGDVQMYGQEKTSHVKVATDPMAGDRTLSLQSAPVNWQVGDRLVLTGTQYPSERFGQKWDSLTQDEEVVVTGIEGDRVTLDRALKFDHTTPRGDLKAYVANQSRNVVIQSENGEAVPTGQRGHTMFMHSNDVDIRYAEFRDLGRTDKTKPIDNFKDTGGTYPERVLDAQGNPVPGARQNITGRYSAHIHRSGTEGAPVVMVGNVVDGSPGWGFVVHDSSAILERNVAYDVDGGAFVTESGNETGAMRNNISIKTGPGIDDVIEKQGRGTHDFARTGVGFWFQGRLVENENNVAAGSRNTGMFYFHRGVDMIPVDIDNLPVPELARRVLPDGETVNVDQPPIQGFKNNEVFASGTGLHVIKDFPQQTNDLRTVLDGFKGWEVDKGSKFQYTSHYTLNDFDLIGSENPTAWKNQGLELNKTVQDFVFNNMTVDGFGEGIAAQPDVPGQGVAQVPDRGLVWIDLTLKNNKTDLNGIDIPPEEWLKSSDLTPGRLEFEVSDDADFFVEASEQGSYVEIKGVKTDSLGSVNMPIGNESLSFDYQGIRTLLDQQGYYTLADGTYATVANEYIADRVTGELKKYPFVITFKEQWWPEDAEYKGELDPNSLGGPTKFNLPESEFQLALDPIAAVPPVTGPVTPEPELPVPEVPAPEIPVPEAPVPELPVSETPVPEAPAPEAPVPEAPVPEAPVPEPPVSEPPAAETPVPEAPAPEMPVPEAPVPEAPVPEVPAPEAPVTETPAPNPVTGEAEPVATFDFESIIQAVAQDSSTGGRDNSGDLWHGVAHLDGLNGSKGLKMDGTGSVRLKNSTDINLGIHEQRSLSLWFKADAISADTNKQVLYEEGGNARGLNAYLDDDKLYVGGWNRPASESGWQGSWLAADGVTAGDWHHVALVLDGSSTLQPDAMTAYLDGEKIGTDQGSQLWGHSDRIALGNIAGATRFHDGIGKGFQGLVGSMDEVKIFNQALTGEQVQALATLG